MLVSWNNAGACARDYSDFVVVYCLDAKMVLTLESVAADICRYVIDAGQLSVDEICLRLSGEYDCDPDDVAEDLADFVDELYSVGAVLLDGQVVDLMPRQGIFDDGVSNIEGEVITALEQLNRLYSATIEMTYACNEQCVHCYAHFPGCDTSSRHMRFEDYKSVIDQLEQMGCLHLAFTGGDPFVHPDFLDVFEYAREKGFVCDIYTNGIALASDDVLSSRIARLKPRAFYMSLYGSSGAIHDGITRVSGSFDKTLAIARRLVAEGFSVVFNMMVIKTNHFDLPNMIDVAKSIGASYRVSMSLVYRNDGSEAPMNYFLDDKDSMKAVIEIARDSFFSVDVEVGEERGGDYMCGAGVTSLCISPDGTVYPCLSLKIPLGTVSSGIQQAWDSDSKAEVVRSLRWGNSPACSSCETRSTCLHCAGMSQLETGDIFSCNTCDRLISQCLKELSLKK